MCVLHCRLVTAVSWPSLMCACTLLMLQGITQSLMMSAEYHFTLRLFSCNTGRIVVSLMPDSSLSDLRGEPHHTLTLFKYNLLQISPPAADSTPRPNSADQLVPLGALLDRLLLEHLLRLTCLLLSLVHSRPSLMSLVPFMS